MYGAKSLERESRVETTCILLFLFKKGDQGSHSNQGINSFIGINSSIGIDSL